MAPITAGSWCGSSRYNCGSQKSKNWFLTYDWFSKIQVSILIYYTAILQKIRTSQIPFYNTASYFVK
jgi:hypothetical protein